MKSPKTLVKNLLNIGPKGDGSIPKKSVRIFNSVGKWLERNGAAIYQSKKCQPERSNYASFTRRGNMLYMHVAYWPGETVSISGLRNKVKSVRLFVSGKDVKFDQDDFRVRMTGLAEKAPDNPVTTLAIECDGEPKQETDYVRKERPRVKA